MSQLANLTFCLLRSRSGDIHFAVGEVRKDVALVAKLFLRTVDSPLSRSHSTYLGPYYSSTSTQSLKVQLTALVNALSKAQTDNTDAQAMIRNIERWADELYRTEGDLLLEAIKVKSQFAFDMIMWITGVTEILLAVSNSPACDHHRQRELRNHARWLIATLAMIPDDKETVVFVENFRVTEELFEAAVTARNFDCDEIARDIEKMLLSWTFKAGRYQTGWGVLDRGLAGLAVLALMGQVGAAQDLKNAIAAHLSGEQAPEQEIRNRAARELMERAQNLRRPGHFSSSIEMAIAESDLEQMGPLMKEIAGLLSPVTIH